MNVITVIPLTRGIFKEHLSYFTSKQIELGSLVTVPLRKKEIPALVVASEPARNLKSELRSAEFKIRKIEKINSSHFFHPALITSAHNAARYFATTTGAVLQSLVPKTILENAKDLSTSKETFNKDEHPDIQNAKYIFQSEDTERMATYKSYIRETFARNQSVFFCLPTIQNIEQAYDSLEKGIGAYTYVLHSKLSKKELLETWNKIMQSKRPVLIIATGGFLAIPRHDIGAIIIDNENASTYKTMSRPFIDYRTFAEMYAKEIGIKLIYGDVLLRTETMKRYHEKDLMEFAPIKVRTLSTAERRIVDMHSYKKDFDSGDFTLISEELDNLIKHNRESNEHLFLLATRKGLHPITVCSDCGTIVNCTECSAPVTLHKRTGGNVFACHKCGTRRSADEHCSQCESWRLTPLGIGTELAEETIRKTHPDTHIFRLDSESASTHKKTLALIEKYNNTPGSILIGTEKAIPYLSHNIDNVAILSVDALFSLPNFRINERIFHQLIQLYTKASKQYLIQTRNKDQSVFDHVIKGNLLDFHREEIEARKELGYPPFKTFIKVSLEGPKAKVQQEMKKVEALLSDYNSIVFPAFTQEIKGKYRMHALIKLKLGDWPNNDLLERLQQLPLSFAINVDPEDLL